MGYLLLADRSLLTLALQAFEVVGGIFGCLSLSTRLLILSLIENLLFLREVAVFGEDLDQADDATELTGAHWYLLHHVPVEATVGDGAVASFGLSDKV